MEAILLLTLSTISGACCTAQNKPAGATYQRVETSDAAARNVEMQPVAAQRVQQLQPPPYIGYAVAQPLPPAAFQQMSNNVRASCQ